MHLPVSISSYNMNIRSCSELVADRIKADLAENLSGLRIAGDRYEEYIASRFVGILSSELGRRHFCTDCRSDKLQDRRPERILIA